MKKYYLFILCNISFAISINENIAINHDNELINEHLINEDINILEEELLNTNRIKRLHKIHRARLYDFIIKFIAAIIYIITAILISINFFYKLETRDMDILIVNDIGFIFMIFNWFLTSINVCIISTNFLKFDRYRISQISCFYMHFILMIIICTCYFLNSTLLVFLINTKDNINTYLLIIDYILGTGIELLGVMFYLNKKPLI